MCSFGEWELALAWTVVSNELYFLFPPTSYVLHLLLYYLWHLCATLLSSPQKAAGNVCQCSCTRLLKVIYMPQWGVLVILVSYFFLVFYPRLSPFIFYLEISISRILQLAEIPYFVLLCCFSHNQLCSPRSSCSHTLAFPLWYYWSLCVWLFGLLVDFAFCLYFTGFVCPTAW